MPPADPSDAGTSSRRPDSIAPRRSLSSSAGTPGPTSWTGSASAWPSPGGSSRARPVPWPSWGSGDEDGRGHRRGDDPLPPAVAGDRQRDVLRGHEDGPRFRGPHPGGRGHGRERDRAGRLRRRPHEGRVPRGRLRRLPEAVYPGLHRRGDRRLQHDRGMVACRLRPRGRRPRRERGEDVLVPAAPAERVRAHLGPDPGPAAEAEPGLDLSDGDEPLHARPWGEEGRHRPGRGQEQAERGRPSVRAARGPEHHGGRRPRKRGDGVARAAVGHQPSERRGLGGRPGVGGFHPAPENQGPCVDLRSRLVHRLDDVDGSRSVFPGIRGAGREAGVQNGEDLGPAKADRLRRAVRSLRLQGAPPPGGPAPREKGGGADPDPRGRHGARRRLARLSLGRPHGGGESDRRDDGSEDRRAVLATHEPGREASDSARGSHRGCPGLGRSDAVRFRGGDVVMSVRITKWPGVELSAADLSEGKVTQTRFRPNAKYAWSAGEAMSRFLAELQDGRLIARTCHSCKRILFPPRMFCEECFRPTDTWTYIQDSGTIETFSVSYLDTDAKRIPDPILVGVISLDGASPKMGMMHYFGEMTKEEIRIGMRVKAVWKPWEERRGSVLDIKYFAPLPEGKK